jgi:hypothetical protein
LDYYHDKNPTYLILAVSLREIVSRQLSDFSFDHVDFDRMGFVNTLVRTLPDQEQQAWLLWDNARCHGLAEETVAMTVEKNFDVTHTAPRTCFPDPVEEALSCLQTKLVQVMEDKMVRTNQYALHASRLAS